jgi:hypothetical protein
LILDDLVRSGDLTNQVLEVVLDLNGEIHINRHEMPGGIETAASP